MRRPLVAAALAGVLLFAVVGGLWYAFRVHEILCTGSGGIAGPIYDNAGRLVTAYPTLPPINPWPWGGCR